ncbi:MAG TPA: exodeoxyribonuclease VII large subunit [Patescibacteria group bacterium]|nr:exodeoxyribonuclease VII large subunit [Patescibacteria group bacterium]
MLPIITVSQFIEQINGIISGEFIVEGEVSQYKVSQGKWIFFDLKDEKASISCFATLFGLRTPLEDGMKIRALGFPKIHDKSGRFSLTVQQVELVGEGSLKKAYLLLKEKLTKEGLFALERKREIPKMPSRIGVIASRDSAAWGDFWRILNNRWQGVEIELYHTSVQGESAVGEIVEAFKYFNTEAKEVDVLVMIRGGGSLEDLAAFNSEEVVRAVYGSKTPVVCGVGHERDETLADYAADVRASTPSNAAERVVPSRLDILNELDYSVDHISEKIQHKITMLRRQVEQQFYFVVSRCEAPLQAGRNLMEKFKNILVVLENSVRTKHEFLLSSERLFRNIDPKRVLERGYSLVRKRSGKLVRRSKDVDIGEEIVIELAEDSLVSRVVENRGVNQDQGVLFKPTEAETA